MWVQERARIVLGDDSSGADPFCSLGHQELPLLFDGLVDVIPLIGAIGKVVVRHVVNLVFLQEVRRDNPWTVGNDLVNPLAMPHGFRSFLSSQYCQPFSLVGFRVACHTYDEMDVRKSSLCLLELTHMPSESVNELEEGTILP